MGRYDLIAPFGDDADYQAFAPEKYDASGGSPAAWRLSVRLTAADQPIVAALAGQLSTVAPDEIPPTGIPVKIPRPQDGALAATDDPGLLVSPPPTTPESTTLYLSPFEGDGAFAFGDLLRSAGLGTEIRWLKYTNVDVESLRELTLTIPRLGALETMTDDDVFAAFLAGELTVGAGSGTTIGRISASVDDGTMEFAVHTDVGYADPVAMWQAVNPLSRFSAIETSWPYLSSAEARHAAVTSLFPMAVLHHARIAYQLTDPEWRALGDTQKTLYWAALRAKYGQGAASPFLFAREDMPNVFQLEALIEFYLAYPRPAQGGFVPDGPSTPVDLVDPSTTWHFVFLEPFVDLLGAPEMIGPAYALEPVTIDSVVYGQDRFDAALFLVYNGVPRHWHRWTTYTAHTWLTGHDQKSLEQQSSIVGNIPYTFKSRNGSITPAINYAFIVFDPDTNAKEACPGRFYYNDDLHDDANGKTEVMVHVAYTDTATNPQAYNGSAGCLVSPSFMRLRDQMLGFLSTSPAWNTKLEPLRGASLGKSADIYAADLKVFASKPRDSIINVWNTAFQGKLWLVRPDESTKR
jgi:hypothetical protein